MKEGIRCIDNILICLGFKGKDIVVSVIKLWLVVMVICNRVKDLLRFIDFEVCFLFI